MAAIAHPATWKTALLILPNIMIRGLTVGYHPPGNEKNWFADITIIASQVFIIPHIYGFLSSQSKTTASKTNVSYITAGLLLQHYGGQSRTRQFGSAVALQGLFLLAFDSYLLYRSARYMSRVMPLLESASFAGKSDFVLPGIRVAW